MNKQLIEMLKASNFGQELSMIQKYHDKIPSEDWEIMENSLSQSHQTALKILLTLENNELTYQELEEHTGINANTVKQYIYILEFHGYKIKKEARLNPEIKSGKKKLILSIEA